jgi:cellulose synthase/poly-beta-1,6-N-acetylglucosamine synthase-like glycosyltransferase
MMRLIRAILFLAGALLALPVAYLLLLTGAATAEEARRRLRARTRPAAQGAAPRTRFLVLIPAHNEEALLPATLDSLARLDYPRDLYTVHVVADNCDDRTAEVARAKGSGSLAVRVHERRDPIARGKGHALRWLLERIRDAGEPHDAILILDADTVVTPNFLRALAARFERGERIIQAYYAVRDPQRSWGAGLRYAALAAVHYLRPSARMALGGSTGLKGNGMLFAADILRRFSWTNDLAEDVEYHMQLILAGERVTFAPEAVLYAEMPGTLRGSRTQNVRWERGRLEQVRRYAPRLLREGLRRRSFLLFDAAVEQLIPPFSVIVGGTLALLPAAMVARARRTSALAAALLAGEALYSLAALLLARAPTSVYRALLYAPAFIAWKCRLYVRVLLGRDRGGWIRTQRGEERNAHQAAAEARPPAMRGMEPAPVTARAVSHQVTELQHGRD